MTDRQYASFDEVFEAIREDEQNRSYTQAGIDPLYSVHHEARIVIIGQAPGRVAQQTRLFWNDRSGDRLRAWLGIDRDAFYGSERLAILPMDFYFPGTGHSGDLPPRKGFADKWHPVLLSMMPECRLTILVGSYATRHYLHLPAKTRLTDVVRNWRDWQPDYFPLVHPSPRNQIWERKNPWFEQDVLPHLREQIAELMI